MGRGGGEEEAIKKKKKKKAAEDVLQCDTSLARRSCPRLELFSDTVHMKPLRQVYVSLRCTDILRLRLCRVSAEDATTIHCGLKL